MCSYPHGASVQDEDDLCVCGVTIMPEDFTTSLETLQEAHSQAIGAPKVPTCFRAGTMAAGSFRLPSLGGAVLDLSVSTMFSQCLCLVYFMRSE